MKTLYTGVVCPNPDFIHTPLIEIKPLEDDTPLRKAVSSLQDYDYLLFTSRFAVKYWSMAGGGFDVANLVSIGKTTTAALTGLGVDFKKIHQPDRDDSYGVIEWFSGQNTGSVLIPRSDIALPIIPDGLRRLGFKTDTVTAYLNRIPDSPTKADLASIDRIIFTSPSTVDNFIKLYGSIPQHVTIETRGIVTQKRLDEISRSKNIS